MWESSIHGTAGRLIVLDGKRGVRLSDRSFSAGDALKVVRNISLHIQSLEQQQTGNTGQQLVSILSVRNVDLPPSRQHEISQTVSAIEQAIATQPDLTLLERTKLRYVALESNLPLAQRQAELLAAATLLTLEISTQGNGIAVKVFAKQQRNKPLEQTSVQVLPTGDTNVVCDAVLDLLTKLPRNADDVSNRDHEIAKLVEEGIRLQASSSFASAALCFESAYVLGARGNLSNMMVHALDNQVRTETLLHARPNAIKTLSEPQWIDLAKLATYRLQYLRESHRQQMLRPSWPFVNQPSRFPADRLTSDFILQFGLFPSLNYAHVDLPTQTAARDAVNDYLVQAERLIFDEFAADARHKLTADDLHRFETELKACRLNCWSKNELRYFASDWPERFAIRFTENLDNENWLVHCDSILRAVEYLPDAVLTGLIDRFDGVDKSMHPRLALVLHFIRLQARISRNLDAPYDSDAGVDQQVEVMLDRLVDQYVQSSDDQVTTQFVSAESLGFRLGEQHTCLNNVIGRTIELIPDLTRRNASSNRAFLLGLENGHVIPYCLTVMLSSASRDASTKDTIDKAVALFKSQTNAFQNGDQILSRLMRKRDSLVSPIARSSPMTNDGDLPLGWKHVQEVLLPKQNRVRCEILNSAINNTHFYVQSQHFDRQHAKLVLQIHRKNLYDDRELELVSHFDFSQSLVDARMKPEEGPGGQRHFSPEFLSHSFDQHEIRFSESAVLIPTARAGLIVAPKNGEPPYAFDAESGLPSNYIQQVAAIATTVYAWVGERTMFANLVAIDLTTREVRLLVSCQRQQPLSPLENFPGAWCDLMTPAPNNELAMVMVGRETRSDHSRVGLWIYDPKEHSFEQTNIATNGQQACLLQPFQIAIPRLDADSRARTWTVFDLTNRQFQNFPAPEEKQARSAAPIWRDDSVIWWHRKFNATAFRQDRDSGKVTQWRVLPEGRTSVSSVQFHQGEDIVIVRSGLGRMWILRDPMEASIQ
ncbi:MAG: hypothetical protein R3C05_12025 [Pirellulaceae bacterium]